MAKKRRIEMENPAGTEIHALDEPDRKDQGKARLEASDTPEMDAPYRPTVRIIFRGLMIFHNNKHSGKERFEAGVLNVEGHTFTVSVLAKSEKREKEIWLEKMILTPHEVWNFEIEGSEEDRVIEYTGGDPSKDYFDNTKYDFRWLADLEGAKFHPEHGCPIGYNHLTPVITIPYGEVYTRLITKRLSRRKADKKFRYFGYAAQEVGFDINLKSGGKVSLFAGKGRDKDDDLLFELEQSNKLRYTILFDNSADPVQVSETARTATDSLSDSDDRAGGHGPEGGAGHKDYSRYLIDHFHFFYRILPIHVRERYEFRLMDDEPYDEPRRPHPNPAICPQSRLSKSTIVSED